jgi:3'(2'), 5'-bisphosphate nucleotidase
MSNPNAPSHAADLARLRRAAVAIATAAGEKIIEIYQAPGADALDISSKQDNSPLTAADLASHRHIVAALAELTPTLPILSEESASVPYAERSGWQRYWLVDPLDGTKEFIKRNGEFTVNIALIDNGRPVLGVVQVPVQNCCYSAAAGEGAFRQQGDHHETPIRVTTPLPVGQPARVVGSRSHASPSLRTFAERLGEHRLLSIGSSLKFCLVAEGKADVYPRLGPTSEWDTAAAQCLVEQAGGAVLALSERDHDYAIDGPLGYNGKESLLNPYFLVCGDSAHDWSDYLKNLLTSP